MPTECVQNGGRCGALYSIWMNGTFPDTEEVANVTACTASYSGDCCSHPMDIQIKNCSSFLVYNLVAVSSCPQRYCFGSEMPCHKGETSLNGFSPGCKYEPCLPTNYRNIDQWERSVGNINGGQICDNVLEPGWYRPISKAGKEMPTSCPKNGQKCGTTYPIWMNGTNPGPNKISNVTACVSSYNGGCCTSSYDIQVKNCGGFFIYNLQHTDGCFQAYCFGTEIPCPLGETSDNNFTPGCEFDPCQSINYNTLKEEVKRSSNYTLLAGDEPIDDSSLKSGWYRIDSSTGNDIVTKSVKMYQCGTIYPLWMNDTLPAKHDKTVERKICRSGPSGNTCVEEYKMKVRNCGKYRTYFLSPTTVNSGYCFGTLAEPMSPNPTEGDERIQFYIWIIISLTVIILLLIGIILFRRFWKCKPIEKSKISSTVHTSPPTYDEAMQNGKKKKEAL
ncbi:uncharacterized protein [Mytilus edulis]|uniref:uncharacterized protein n=1 Tax=Mytilus edulis TaxID=6550 RepID=UPI0039EF4318